MVTVIRPSRVRCVKGRIPRHERAVLTARHPARAGARRALRSDGQASWYPTFWDIRYVPTTQISDHFHQDHKEYYEPYMNNYRIGLARDHLISNLAPTPGADKP